MKYVNLTPEQILSTFQVGSPAPRRLPRHAGSHTSTRSAGGTVHAAGAADRLQGAPACGA